MNYFEGMTETEIARRNAAVKEMDMKRALLCKEVQYRYTEAKLKKAAEFKKPKKK